ncbi:MAG: hypothetical protein HPY60_09215 [Candidatus Methanofastidiosum sp.]|nr:hypothetical protein [Methanofastidiosum sp.]
MEDSFRFQGEFFKVNEEGDFFIFGPASAELLDSQGDVIRIDAVKKALPELLKRARVTVDHKDQIVGEIVESFEKKGLIYKTEVRPPNNEELSKFCSLEKEKEALFVLAKVWDDTEYCKEVRKAIEKGDYRSYSISGNVLKSRPCKSSEGCTRIVSDLNLSAVTICRSGANPAAQFDILKEEKEMPEEVTNAEKKEPEFLTRSDFEAYRNDLEKRLEPISRIDEILGILKATENKTDAKLELEKIREEIKKEILLEFRPVQKSEGVSEKEISAGDIVSMLSEKRI